MKSRILILFTAIGVMFSSCEKKLDLSPEQSLAENIVFTSKATAQSALLGVYSTCQLLDVFGSMPQIVGDFQADNTEFVGSFPTLQEIALYTTLSTNTNVQGWWQNHYRVILRANAVIDNVGGITESGFTDAEKKQMIAEAKFLRALTYFQMTNLWGQPFQVGNGSRLAVPLVLKSFTGVVEFPGRATVAQLHTQIKKDLDEALPDLPITYTTASNQRGRATKGAANGLLSRLHLYRGEWQQAADRANDVINATAQYSLAANYSFYDANTPEEVFNIQNTTTDNGRTGSGGWASYHRPASQGGRGDCPFSADLIAAFNQEPGDRRFLESDIVTAANTQQMRMTRKFPKAVTNDDDSPIIRVTEMHLNRAEALAEINGINITSINHINLLRARAGLPAWTLTTFLTKAEFLEAIANERRKELCFEGHRRMDLLRRGKSLRPSGPLALISKPGDNLVVMPIPQREIDNNPGLKGQQNPGY